MVASGVLKKVSHSNWATPIVVVVKPDNDVRICGDYKCTVNPVLKIVQHPVPKIDDLFHELIGGEEYTKIDLKDAYHQFELEENSKEITTISTHKGLYK